MKIKPALIASALLSIVVSQHSLWGVFNVSDVSPRSGPEGTSVTLTGMDFDTEATYVVSVNGTIASLGSVSEMGLEFIIASGTKTGFIEVSENGEAQILNSPFTVTDISSGTFNAPTGVSLMDYYVSSRGQLEEVSEGDGSFPAILAKESPTMLMAFRNASDPVFLAMVTDPELHVTIDATTTAIALSLISPFVPSRNFQHVERVKEHLAGKQVVTNLSNFISDHSTDGIDYMRDARFDQLLQAVIEEAMKADFSREFAPQAAASPGTPSDVKLYDLNPDYVGVVPSTPVTLKVEIDEDYKLEVDVDDGKTNPVEWFLEIVELDPDQDLFSSGLDSFPSVTDQSVYTVGDPMFNGFVGSAQVFEEGNPFSRLSNALMNVLSADQTHFNPNSFQIDRDRPAIYAVHMYSGNLFYNSNFLPSRSQSGIIDSIDPSDKWGTALTMNTIIAGVDIAAIVIDVNDLLGDENYQSFLSTLFGNLAKASALRIEGSSEDELDVAFYDTARAVAKSVIEFAIDFIYKEGEEQSLLGVLNNYAARLTGLIKSVVDVSNKISAVGQLVERGSGIVLPGVLSVERWMVLAGDPFVPQITGISPLFGRDDDRIIIYGKNFPQSAAALEVDFCHFEGNSDVPTASLPAVVTEISSTHAVIEIPLDSQWNENDFPDFKANICVSKQSQDEFTVSDDTFQYIPPPDIELVSPSTSQVGSIITIIGKYFDEKNISNNQLYLDGNFTGFAFGATDTALTVRLPDSESLIPGDYSLSIKVDGEESNLLNFSVVDQDFDTDSMAEGSNIAVNEDSMTNSADDHNISLGEAILIASGLLGRAVEIHDPCEDILDSDQPGYCGGPQKREIDDITAIDEISGKVHGANFRDIIRCSFSGTTAVNGVIQLTNGDAITAGGSFPQYELSGASFVLDGVSGVTLQNFKIINSPGDAVTLRNGANKNTIVGIVVENCAGVGIKFDGTDAAVSDNKIIPFFSVETEITNPGSHGIHFLEGASRNEVDGITITGAGGHGIFLENDAQSNTFHGINWFGQSIAFGIEDSLLDGIHLSGAMVMNNDFSLEMEVTTFEGDDILIPKLTGSVKSNTGYGLVIENEANSNTFVLQEINENGSGGVLIDNATLNNIGAIEATGYGRILNNGGPGVTLRNGASENLIQLLGIAGNNGSGVEIDGPDCELNEVSGIATGYDYWNTGGTFNPLNAPNQGHGIHLLNGAHHNQIGYLSIKFDNFLDNAINNNTGSGILIEGNNTDFNLILNTEIGSARTPQFFDWNGDFPENGGPGIHIRNGASHNRVGDSIDASDVLIMGDHSAGILIEGTGTDGNSVVNCRIGHWFGFPEADAPEDFPQIGIHLKDGVKDTIIGETGKSNLQSVFMDGVTYEFHNNISKCKDVGILVENCGGDVTGTGALSQPNIIRHNAIGYFSRGNEVGLRITGNAKGNVIGEPGSPNFIRDNDTAGIEILGNVINEYGERNRISNNYIQYNGDDKAGTPGDPKAVTPFGVGVLIKDFSSGNVIGENFRYNDLTNKNTFSFNVVGIYIESSDFNHVQGNSLFANDLAGIVIRNGQNNIIGGDSDESRNELTTNGGNNSLDAGIIFSGSERNSVQNNLIGGTSSGNDGAGILLYNSPRNLIGGDTRESANTIIKNDSDGIRIHGTLSTDNRIWNNHIGTNSDEVDYGNLGHGIYFDGGANGNLVGGEGLVETTLASPFTAAMPNKIAWNALNGVAMESDSTENSVLSNEIFANTAKGIATSPSLIPSPVFVEFAGNQIAGSIPDPGLLPVGTRIQAFAASTIDQGQIFLGEVVTQAAGDWIIRHLAPFTLPEITLTATHPTTGATSEFGNGSFNFSALLELSDTGAPGIDDISLGSDDIPVLPLILTAHALDVRINSVTLTATGALNDADDILAVKIYEDTNKDGRIGEGDRLIGGPATYDSNDGVAIVSFDDTSIAADETQNWLVTYQGNESVADGTTFGLKLDEASDINAFFSFPTKVAAVPVGIYPLLSDLFTHLSSVGSISFQDWKEIHFPGQVSNDNIAGISADPDGDGLINLIEYALGLDPMLADNQTGITSTQFESNRLVFEFRRLGNASGATLIPQVSHNLGNWDSGAEFIEEISAIDNGDGTETVKVRTLQTIDQETAVFMRLNIVGTDP